MLRFERAMRYGFPDGVDVSIDGVDILLYLNPLDIFAQSILILLSLLYNYENKRLSL